MRLDTVDRARPALRALRVGRPGSPLRRPGATGRERAAARRAALVASALVDFSLERWLAAPDTTLLVDVRTECTRLGALLAR
ncbi:hypothetical protein C5E02_14020 [Rathayibacter rathayi]|uniref:MftR C-terminal domain-containing protein n=1 Tax=Rathayibacter rathayi TaxID=33887 RepID=A0ABX5A8I6_RATRA|nr:hypothetical protein C1O28_14320 [Rathayibacter rathayi]PPF42202.1 hypothetical protein C5C08_15250 [Rathayibacter rathayi]PPF74768.1 hypothetical protein C5C14_15340 [Rathayibacter rathayi]PPG10530.1 hypothetical protein C5C11_13965 [Rathayibacter rathayi]PPG36798.1 hypothetical protein C5C20_14910 [Rathayibacter rathayi]